MARWNSVDDYLAALPDDRRAAMDALRQMIRDAAPEATESIAYDMPAFRSHGRFLVSYAAFKEHYSLFPANPTVIEAVGAELTPYLAGRGTIRFLAGKPIPSGLVRKVVTARLAETGGGSVRD
jgi:uncharacterized protein YdhG (YjbR/CyaY superfamily)